MMTVADIEAVIAASGSDNLPAFGGKFEGGIHCQQIPDELAPCIHAILASGHDIASCLEIGVAAGGTTFLMNHFFSPERIVLVDDGKHHKVGLRPSVLTGIKYKEIVGRSCDLDVVSAVHEDSPYDIIIIDSDHSYQNVSQEIEKYLWMLSQGGFLIVHDSVAVDDVARIVKELKMKKALKFINEFVSKTHKPCGIALFQRGK